MAQVWRVTFFCVLFLGTTWASDSEVAPQCSQVMESLLDQSIDPQSFDQGAGYLGHLSNVSSGAECMEACCKMEGCQLALAEPSQDGLFNCLLLSCGKEGQDTCSLSPASGYTAYRKQDAWADTGSIRANTDVCRAPVQVGKCRASFPRFYYDVTDQTCKSFYYGGCDGNGNNFERIEDCQAACAGVVGSVELSNVTSGPVSKRMLMGTKPEHCSAPASIGLCRASIPRFFYNASAGTCQSFIYGGCGGNTNNYATMEQCMAACPVMTFPNPMKSTDNKEACTAAYETGPCRASFPSFYFNPQTKTCLPFIYGGCAGNKNRYGSVEECMARCGEAEGQHEHHLSRPNAAFFLVATLAVMSVLLLVGLFLLLLQRGKVRRQAHEDKEELLPADQLLNVASA